MFKRYFENTRSYQCPDCGNDFKHSFWQWFTVLFKNDISRHRYVKCPHCGARHWLQAKKVM